MIYTTTLRLSIENNLEATCIFSNSTSSPAIQSIQSHLAGKAKYAPNHQRRLPDCLPPSHHPPAALHPPSGRITPIDFPHRPTISPIPLCLGFIRHLARGIHVIPTIRFQHLPPDPPSFQPQPWAAAVSHTVRFMYSTYEKVCSWKVICLAWSAVQSGCCCLHPITLARKLALSKIL